MYLLDRFRRINLNLLLVFDALHRHGSVVAAANELAMSSSAVSHVLARLRDAMSDELFVRCEPDPRQPHRFHDPTGKGRTAGECSRPALRRLGQTFSRCRRDSPRA
ncbi:LysR family transcriptional regulator [Ralstonia pseudosolanacearum]|nr:LysR family transcriptional regulator [Ralstonia pseudosolanacearum]